MNTGNIPATPLEKLYVRMKQAEELGKEFDEELERRVLGLGPPANDRDPVFIPAAPERQALTLREDQTTNEEMRKEAAEALKRAGVTGNVEGGALEESATRIRELEEQIANLQAHPRGNEKKSAAEHKDDDAAKKAKDDRASGANKGFPDGEPTKDWSKSQVTKYLAFHDYPQPAGGLAKLSNVAALDYALGEIKKRDNDKASSRATTPTTDAHNAGNVPTPINQPADLARNQPANRPADSTASANAKE